MFNLTIIISVLLLLPYLAGVFYILIVWTKTNDTIRLPLVNPPFVSVLIPFRNEEENLSEIIQCLKDQNYDPQLSEFIFINDHSTDNGFNLAKQLTQYDKRFSILNLPEEFHGKKCALEYAITKTNGEIIVQTDADCTVGNQWLTFVIQVQQQTNSDLVIGPVVIESGSTFFDNLQTLEFASLSSVVAGSALAGHPLLINAANMAYRKESISKLENPFERQKSSGDDQFLLQSMQNKKMKISYIKSEYAIVKTKPIKKLSDFLQQRARWASKSKSYKGKLLTLTAILIFLLNSWIFVAFILGLFDYYYLSLWFILICIKSLADYPLLRYFQKWSKQTFTIPLFAVTQLLYSFYTTFTGLWALFHPVKWKQRKVY